MAVLEWVEETLVVMARGLLAGFLSGVGIGLVAATVLAGPVGGVFGALIGGLVGIVLAIVAAPALAVCRDAVLTDAAARVGGALASALAVTVWAIVLHAGLANGLGWAVACALVGSMVGPWTVFGRRR